MIAARHKRWAIALYDIYIRRLLRNSFHALHLFGGIPAVSPDRPVLLLPNHNSWWDGFLVDAFNKYAFKRKIYLMMLEEQLHKYRFFSSVGAYSIQPGNGVEVRKSLRYTAEIMRGEQGNALITLFPQGDLVPFGTRLEFQPGYEVAVRLYGKPVTVLPLAMRIETTREQHPQAFFLAGTPTVSDGVSVIPAGELQERHFELQDRLVEMIRTDAASTVILHGKRSAHATFDTVTGRL